MRESSKTNAIRPAWFAEAYLQGRLIDIGAGDDLVCPWAEGFDLADGDANVITRFRSCAAYDAVHSSHCLEHMHDPAAALREWWALLKPGGHMVIVVPEETLYEQYHWPSVFNGDHKWTFCRTSEKSWSPRSVNIDDLFSGLPGCQVVSVVVQDNGYDHALLGSRDHRPLAGFVTGLMICVRGFPVIGREVQRQLFVLLHSVGYLVDQTLGDALAQIQVVARKQH